ncbi:Imm12 family immunity protein [uncultured Aquimarina sp.]|uniref:Imm12 family immunity protein n=1 Tax=uncultured Aquimarina sp. TaxID=575652 RepID=UPI00262CA7BD|nr:Imm12 family immunity protein [uncultured Aquimarina sp.]
MEITLTSQIGGSDAGSKFRKPIVKLRKSLKLLEEIEYSESIQKIKVFLRISGEIENYKESTGVYNYRLDKKNKTASAEIIISNESWKQSVDIGFLLSDLTKIFFNALSEYLIKKNIELNRESLLRDVENIVIANNNSGN